MPEADRLPLPWETVVAGNTRLMTGGEGVNQAPRAGVGTPERSNCVLPEEVKCRRLAARLFNGGASLL